MGQTTIDPKALEDAVRNALQTLLPTSPGTASNPRTEFYDKFQREAEEHDRYFLEKYGADLDISLLFATLFSAVASAFIVAIQAQLQPDYGQLNYAVLMFMANSTLGKIPTNLGVDPTGWAGPDPTTVHVQAALYSSLATSLLAAFVAMLGKQWLKRYSRAESRGSPIEHSRDRQRKMNGMTTWHFDLVMECLPLMLQAALLLFGYGLSNYLFTIDKTVAVVVVSFSGLGLLFYFLVVSAATLSYNCPFQTPLSLALRYLLQFNDKYRNYLEEAWSRFRHTFYRGNRRGPMLGGLSCFGRPHALQGNPGHHVQLAVVGPFDQLPPLVAGETGWGDYVLDSDCITWLFQKSRDVEAIMAIMKLIPEIVWHASIGTTSLERLYHIVLGCFDRSSEPPVVIPKLREKAYLSAKALVHLAVQRKGVESERDVFQSISRKHTIIGSRHYDADSDLESTLGMIDRVFKDGDPRPMRWEKFSFTVPHHIWMGYILRCHTWRALRNHEPLPGEAEQFVLHSLGPVPPPPAPIVAECLHIISLVLGLPLQNYDQVIDENDKIRTQIDNIYKKLEKLWNDGSTEDEIDCALKAMKLIAPLSTRDVATKSYHLFHVVMRTPISPPRQEKKCEASRLALHGAYKWIRASPSVGDPGDVLTFLYQRFKLAARDENKDESIQDALGALAYASDTPATIEALKRYDATDTSFVRGICSAFKDDRLPQLRAAAVFFLPLIGDKLFNTRDPIIGSDEMKTFCVDWASSVDNTRNAQKAALNVLLYMINSPHWRPHIVAEKWKLLEYFPVIPEDCQLPLKMCLTNPGLMHAISEMGNPDAVDLWSKILWLNYNELAPDVQENLKAATEEAPKCDIIRYLHAVESELARAEEAKTKYATTSKVPAAVALDRRIASCRVAKGALTAIKRQKVH